MTIFDAIQGIDGLKHNTYRREDKLRWLSNLDGMVWHSVLFPQDKNAAFHGYDARTQPDTQLLIPAPFDELYLHWLEARIDYYNGEYDPYNNAMAMFHGLWKDFCDWHRRQEKSQTDPKNFFCGKEDGPCECRNWV